MTIYIIDLGSQYTHVIWRTVRDLGFKVQIVQKNDEIEIFDANGVILSGGPASVHNSDYGELTKFVLESIKSGKLDIPILGICFGHQLIAHTFGGKVERGEHAEYGIMKIVVDEEDHIFQEVPKEFEAWVSHFDEVKELPEGFIGLAHSDVCKFEAMKMKGKPIFGVQFHPEVWHTQHGEQILSNFLKLVKK